MTITAYDQALGFPKVVIIIFAKSLKWKNICGEFTIEFYVT